MHKVTGYMLSYCPWCKRTKKFFQEQEIEFEFIDFDLQDEEGQKRIEEEMMKNSRGGISFPYVVIDEIVVVGYNPARYKQVLALTV